MLDNTAIVLIAKDLKQIVPMDARVWRDFLV